MSLTKASYSMIEGAPLNILDFGAIPNGTTDATSAIQAALDAAFDAGGAAVFVPSGEYLITDPLIVRSNTDFYGAGASSIIKRNENTVATPENNLIHIGYGYEWNENGQKFNAGSNNDATLIELIGNDFGKITTYNASVRNMTVKANGGGLGIFVMNAGNIVIDSIWSEDTLTPVNIANDAVGWQAGCFNVSVSNIFQISANTASGRSWYDLVFGGSAIKCNITRCFNNPDTPSALDGSIVLSGSIYWTITDNVIIHKARIANVGKRAILSSALTTNTDTGTVIANNTLRTALDGVFTKGSNYVIANNTIDDCTSGVTLDGTISLVSGNTFTNNTTDVGGTTSMIQNSFTGNLGLNTAAVAGSAFDPREYNTFTGNTNSSFLFNNNDDWPQLKARYIILFPIDPYISTTDLAKIAARTDGNLRVTAPNTISMYFKLPAYVRIIKKVVLNGFAGGAGDEFNPQLVGLDGPQNTNAMTVVENLPSQTTTVGGDFTMDFIPNDPFFAQGTYYVKVNFIAANTTTQFRNIQLVALCDA